MPRRARVIAAGVPHHITHRGNNRQDVFLVEEDRRRYQELLIESLDACAVSLLGWCWMSNHVHLIAVPRSEGSLSRLVMRAHSRYAQEFNRRHNRCGHLWHSRFYSCPLGPGHLQTALRYVDLNPVRAGITDTAGRYRWSSALAHVDGADATGLLDRWELERWGGCRDWASLLEEAVGTAETELLRRATSSGAAFGEPAFVKEMERRSGQEMEVRPRGRPKKASAAASSA